MSIISRLLGGIFIALAGYGSTLAISDFMFKENTYFICKIISSAIFPIGIILVIYSESQLFTAKCGSYLKLYKCTTLNVLDLVITYVFNFLGIVIFCVCLYESGYFTVNKNVSDAIAILAQTKSSLSVTHCIIGGILCNVLVCFGVKVLSICRRSINGLIVLYLCIFIFVFCGFEHSIANMYYIFSGILVFPDLIANIHLILLTLFLVTIGNVLGGAIVANLYK